MQIFELFSVRARLPTIKLILMELKSGFHVPKERAIYFAFLSREI